MSALIHDLREAAPAPRWLVPVVATRIALVAVLTAILLYAWLAVPRDPLHGVAAYLPFHITVETFSIVVAVLIFGVTWNAYSRERPAGLVILACSMLASALLALGHLLSVAGMPDFVTPASAEKGITFWLAMQATTAAGLLLAAALPPRPLRAAYARHAILAISLCVVALVHWIGLYHADVLPHTFVPGKGLTPVKIGAEYVIVALFAIPSVLFLRRALVTGTRTDADLFAGAAISLLGELYFTIYAASHGMQQVFGHSYKLIAYACLYDAVFVASVREPYERLVAAARRIEEDKQALRESEEKFRYLFEHSVVGNCLLHPGGEIEVNAAFCRMLGYANEELAHSRWQDITHPDDIAPTQDLIDALVARRQDEARFTKRYLHKSGRVVWTDVSMGLRRDADDAAVYLMTSVLDITDRKRAQDDLDALNRELESRVEQRTAELAAANQELEAFAYSVSHDLRAPLRAVDGFTVALVEDYGDRFDPQGRDYLDRLRNAAVHMGALIDDMLKLSRTTRGPIQRESVDLSAIAMRIAASLQEGEPARRGEFVIAPGVTARCDPRLIESALENLLGNAWKFTGRHATARIEFGAMQSGGETAYYVRDDGAGFDMAYADDLFSPFHRLHSTEEFPGNGIGLATVKRIIARHGGRIWARAAVEQGATFYFTLPDAGTAGDTP